MSLGFWALKPVFECLSLTKSLRFQPGSDSQPCRHRLSWSQYSASSLSIDLKFMHFSLKDLNWEMSWVIWKFWRRCSQYRSYCEGVYLIDIITNYRYSCMTNLFYSAAVGESAASCIFNKWGIDQLMENCKFILNFGP